VRSLFPQFLEANSRTLPSNMTGLLLSTSFRFMTYSPYHDSTVGIAAGYGLDVRGCHSPSPGRGKIFLLSTSSKPDLGPIQPPIQWVPGVLSPGAKWPGREVDYSPPTSAEVKNAWIYTFTPPYVLRRSV
jgi:hypothetical protein